MSTQRLTILTAVKHGALMNILVKLGIVTITCYLTTGQATAQQIEISGVSLGEDISLARNRFIAANAAYKITDIRHPNGKSMGLNGQEWPSPTEISDHFQVLNGIDGKIWFVGRSQNLSAGKRYAKEELVRALLGKYGQPSINKTTGPFGNLYWHYDRSQKLFKGELHSSPCLIPSARNQQMGTSVIGAPLQVPSSFNPLCGRAIEVTYWSNPDSGLTDRWVIRAFDSAVVADALKLEETTRSATKQKKEEAERDAGNRPKI